MAAGQGDRMMNICGGYPIVLTIAELDSTLAVVHRGNLSRR